MPLPHITITSSEFFLESRDPCIDSSSILVLEGLTPLHPIQFDGVWGFIGFWGFDGVGLGGLSVKNCFEDNRSWWAELGMVVCEVLGGGEVGMGSGLESENEVKEEGWWFGDLFSGEKKEPAKENSLCRMFESSEVRRPIWSRKASGMGRGGKLGLSFSWSICKVGGAAGLLVGF